MMSYSQRAAICINPCGQQLLRLMDKKQTNLCVAADNTIKKDLLALANLLGPEICIFKTHIDIVEDFDTDLIVQLQRLSEKHNFFLFEDRKFADIGNTVKHQYEDGIYHIADWADIVNAHSVTGPGIIDGLKETGLSKGRGLLLLAEMSPKGNLIDNEYTQATIRMAKAHKDFVIGFISMRQLSDDPSFIYMTPGVQLVEGGDKFGQQYSTPEYVIGKQKSDIIIVGRGIYEARDPLTEAKKYREAGWKAYLNR